jgi:CheY-like chemotaxis protein
MARLTPETKSVSSVELGRELSLIQLWPMAVVLLVEDNDQVRVVVESYLEELGHKVFSAGSPQGALALLKQTPQIVLLFTDLELTSDSEAGLKLAREAVERRPDLKVLYTSGRGVTDGMKVRFVKDSTFLQKPYTVDGLRTVLREHFKIES